MKTLLIIKGERTTPKTLIQYCQKSGYRIKCLLPLESTFKQAATSCSIILLASPIYYRRSYLNASGLWRRFILTEQPQTKLLLFGYESIEHPAYMDLLQLSNLAKDYLDHIPTTQQLPPLPTFSGMDLQDRLRRFFAGHGQDSVVAVLTRIRLVVQMASRELQKIQTPYAEIYRELIAPAQLEKKWADWRNRWINYAPLFEFSPFATKLQLIGQAAKQIEPWMQSGGMDERSLRDGSTLQTLNFIREELYKIEKQYVV